MIRIDKLSLWVGDQTILADLSLEIRPGETFALIGASGSGKTSLARLLTGLIRPGKGRAFRAAGTVEVAGFDILAAPESTMRRLRGHRIGLIMQALADALNPQMSVLDHMRELLRVRGADAGTAEQIYLDFNVPARLHHRRPAFLSGGEIQRVLTALALAGRPDHLVLDEPTAALDAESRALALAAFKNGAGERAQLLITHDLALARALANRAGFLDGGTLVETGQAEQLLSRPVHPVGRLLIGCSTGATDKASPSGIAAFAAKGDPQGRPDTAGATAVTGLQAIELSHGFGACQILDGLCLRVAEGTCAAILGPSGCGKSTLARILAGFEPLQHGKLVWGHEGTRTPLAHPPSLISQHPHRALARHFSVRDVLMEPLLLARPQRWPRVWRAEGDQTEQVAALLSDVGLPADETFLRRKTAMLSGGEAQRLVIARGLAMQSRCLVADEPTSALDLSARTQIIALLNRLKADRRLTLVLFTHDRSVAEGLADRTYRLAGGRLVAEV
ncbi:ABC transporter ATP-binding protein [Pannonibacter sp. SL95]|uniref:ABC transporter ATP-binding protein n=1 Tax=Pannonibacter sp. SL95 TaxID=2995153 RepID=UPI0022754C71|nr:ATP-binding cassette domain-containing protein [Pannonibacter sp. SL95]MCY1706622.1 ATP-binding cassette domain-containing protein [Pannonibacter sp. SL95]